MRKALRESVGLGSPPTIFTTNASESINAAIKRKVDYKESALPEFIKQMKHLVQSLREEVTQALSGRGQFRLCHGFAHYGTSTQMWMKMRPDQRQEIVSAFVKVKLPMVSEQHGSGGSADDCSKVDSSILSVGAEDSGITSFPLLTLNGMWDKASELISCDNGITPAPGNEKKARMVLSYSQTTPHHVRSHSDGQYLCDSNCPTWVSSQLCLHTLAVV